MEFAKQLIRTCARTFYDTRQILIIDSLLIHSVLHADDLAILLSSHPKEVRKYVGPLRTAQLVHTHSRSEQKVGSSSTRGVQREYYYIDLHIAVDAIKYRMMHLLRKVEAMYTQDVDKKDWRCPRCKAEYDELEVLDSVNEDGFYCQRCGQTLEQTEEALQPEANHEKIRRINDQLAPFILINAKIDKDKFANPTFDELHARRKPVPRAASQGHTIREYVAIGGRGRDDRGNGPETVDASALSINLISGEDQDREDEARKEARRAELAKQNQLPEWHTNSAIGPGRGPVLKNDNSASSLMVNGLAKKADEDEKKPDMSMQSELDAYVAEMEREREEEDRKRAMEDAEEDDEDDEGDFEDVTTSAMGTPASSQQMGTMSGDLIRQAVNGVKREREREFEDDSASGPSSDANTPAGAATPMSSSDAGREAKRVKVEGRGDRDAKMESMGRLSVPEASDDDEGDFEDAI